MKNMKLIIMGLLIFLCGYQLFARKDLLVKPQVLENKLTNAHKLIKEQHDKLVAYQLQLELDKIAHEKEIKLLKLENEHLRDRSYKLGFLSFVLVCFAIYSIKKQQNR